MRRSRTPSGVGILILPLFLTLQCHLLYRTYLVLGGRVGSRRLAPTLHVEGFRCREILGPSTRHVYTRTHRVYACARLVGTLLTAHAQYLDCACAQGELRPCSRLGTEPDPSSIRTTRLLQQVKATYYIPSQLSVNELVINPRRACAGGLL